MAGFKFDGLMMGVVALLVLILLVNILVPIFKPIAVQKAYDAQQPYNITDAAGAQLTITPSTTVKYTDVADIWDIALPVFNILAALALLILVIFEAVHLMKHRA